MNDSQHGDPPGPADTKEARTPVARADTSPREHVAEEIPTVAPYPPRLPSQVQPWAEDETSPGPIGDPPGEEPAFPEPAPGPAASPEPASPRPHATDESEGRESGAITGPSVQAAPDVDAMPLAETVDAVAIPEERSAVEPTSETILEPQPDLSPPPESDGPPAEPAVRPISETVAAASLAEPPPEPPADPEAGTQIEIQAPPAPNPDVDVPEAAAEHPALLDASAPDLLDAPAVNPEHQGPDVDAPLPDEHPEPLREDHIWSGPEAIEPSARRTEPEHVDTLPEPAPETDSRARLEASQLAPRADIGVDTVRMEPAPPPSFVAQSATEQSAVRPLPAATREAIPYVRGAARIAGGIAVTLAATVLVLVILYRWIDPPTSTLMLGQRLTGVEIEQRWVPIERISTNLVHAVILSEDGGFCRHRGVDWSALEEAIESARGGSTITMQVVKNLFLWPQRSYIRKALEIMLAYVVETVWTKERILEIYLNIAEWGPGVFGAEAAARHHFGKAAARLTAQEAAQLAVSLPSPIERQAGHPGWQTRRLADNLLIRMRAVRTTMRCVRVRRGGS